MNKVLSAFGAKPDQGKEELIRVWLPLPVAEFMNNLGDYDKCYLRLILNDSVFNSLTTFIGDPDSTKKYFDTILFQYMHGMEGMGMVMDSGQIDFLYVLNGFITSCSEHLAHPAGKEGENE